MSLTTLADVEDWLEAACHGLADLQESFMKKWAGEIYLRYSEKWRFYHSVSHLADMMQHFSKWKDRIKSTSVVILAILFHDIVYDPKSSSNENDSVALFQKFSSEVSLSQHMTKSVVQLIKATITHMPQEIQLSDEDLHFFLDFDMAILGQSWQDYSSYAANIRKEYCHLEEEVFQQRRIKVLTGFLERPNIYFTTDFQNEFEMQARENIKTEIHKLKSALNILF